MLFAVYYKHGEYEVRNFSSEKALENYLYNYIMDYENHHQFEEYSDEMLENMSLKQLINEAISVGDSILEKQYGMGIVNIIECTGSMKVYGGVHSNN
jgi:peroxiredoxin family protein